jgi:hypothetical protein
MRNRTALRAALRQMSKGGVRVVPLISFDVMCAQCGSYAHVVTIGKGRGGGTQVICNSNNQHRR